MIPPPKPDTISEHTRLLSICKVIQDNQLTPKKFLLAFLTNPHPAIADRRRLWSSSGLDSTMDLLETTVNLLKKKEQSDSAWCSFVLDEAINIVGSQSLPRGYHPNGCFQSSLKVPAKFFSEKAKKIDNDRLTANMPFLYQLLSSVLYQSIPDKTPTVANEVEDDLGMADLDPLEAEGLNLEQLGYTKPPNPIAWKTQRCNNVCTPPTLAYLRNGVQYLACGVTDRVNQYLNYFGLACGRRTAVSALRTVSSEAEWDLRKSYSRSLSSVISPIICIDNLDIEQHIHAQSQGHRTRMFHGTWGYVQYPAPELIATLDPSELTIDSYNEAMKQVPSFQIQPHMLLPTAESEESYKAVWKSQIVHVMLQYIARPDNPTKAIRRDPPPVEKISSTPPKIKMLKLMDAPENSAEGIGQVLDSIAKQTGLDPEVFFGRLQIMDGDLATCRNFNCLRSLRTPSAYVQHSLQNVSFQLGASHTLWNISTCILKAHFGDQHNSMDTGAWRCLDALGVPPAKAMPKNDFSLMINHIEQVHEATILYGLKEIMQTQNEGMDGFDASKPRPKISTAKFNTIVEEFYHRYCTGEAPHEASKRDCPKLHNLLMRLQEFSTVVEANRAMKAGDIGRLINMWKRWSVMSQALKSLRNYSSYLPRMVLMLTEFLPSSMAKLFRHSLLFSPSGREGHFVSKDFYLELQNYWLKFLFNQSGNGTLIERLKNLYSMNIHLLREMMHSIRLDTGATLFTQSHKNIMTVQSMNKFIQMANNFNIYDHAGGEKMSNENLKRVENSYLAGYKKLQKEFGTDPQMSRFKENMPCDPFFGEDKDDETDPTDEPNGYEL
ncbi:hypothetical protein PSTT_11867 [Puccinia striiformis]|uniref:DUF6589 domain-containing protein n=1 Tax=Puccinia striiformis TaxID=27350 RepID=A0A2S4UYI7_9BASI|nr:hypothetical protein PSTT_11867 [Puccinia striiformis]